jgi:hypothetical protein
MTEAEWLACADPYKMLEFLGGKASERKLRLFAVACCRSVWDFITDRDALNAVEVAERFADGLAFPAERDEAANAIAPKVAYYVSDEGFAAAAASATLWPDALDGAGHAAGVTISEIHEGYLGYGDAWQDYSNSLRCIFGPLPFRPVTIDPAWITATVKRLAEAIYEEKAFDRLPILADALEDAGCTDAGILNHCRGGGEHCRGCWPLDLLLGKA